MQFQVQEDVVDAGLRHHQLLRVLIVAQAGCQEHTFQARVTVPMQEPFGQQYCKRRERGGVILSKDVAGAQPGEGVEGL